MAIITVLISSLMEDAAISVDLPDDEPIGKLIPTLIDRFSLPDLKHEYQYPEFAGTKYRMTWYELREKRSGRELSGLIVGTQTLAEAGIQNGDKLQFYMNARAGTCSLEEMMTLISGRTFRELTVVVAIQVKGIVTAVILPKSLPLSWLNFRVQVEIFDRNRRNTFPWSEWSGSSDYVWKNMSSGELLDLQSEVPMGQVIRTGDLLSIMSPEEAATATGPSEAATENALLEQVRVFEAIPARD